MNDDEQLTEQLLDLFVYAPIGLALEARELIPKLADRGRGQVALARLAGTVAGRQRHQHGRTVLDQILHAVGAVLGESRNGPRSETAPEPGNAGSDPLPIPGYDSFTAAQLLPKLADLSDDDLGAVLAHEEAHRGRVTVINRIHQLRA